MKLNRIILPLMACALTWSSCDDQIMEWKNSDGSITFPSFVMNVRSIGIIIVIIL